MNKKIIAALMVAAGALTLSGCASSGDQPAPEPSRYDGADNGLWETSIRLQDGRTIDCIVYTDQYPGGVSCDWEHPISGGK